jgi:hypothetical protein
LPRGLNDAAVAAVRDGLQSVQTGPAKDELHDEYPDLLSAWYAFRDIRARRRAVQWLADNSLIDDEAASRFLASQLDPDLP